MQTNSFWRASRVLALATVVPVAAEHRYSDVHSVANSYISLIQASRSFEKEGHITASKSFVSKLSALDRRVQWSLQKHNMIKNIISSDDWSTYRLEWMRAHLRGLSFQLRRQKNQNKKDNKTESHCTKIPFDEESHVLYDTHIPESYLDPVLTINAHSKLDSLLPMNDNNSPLYIRHAQFQSHIMIPKKEYEPVFRQLVEDVLQTCQTLIPDLQSATVAQQYIDDAKMSCEAWVEPEEGSCKSKMVVNIARAISYDKAQQLAVHELTHHFQNVLMEQHLYDQCPEMRYAPEMGPMGIVLEGGAEAMVELYFNPSSGGLVNRVKDLEKRMPSNKRTSPKTILEVERITWFGLWPTIVRIARDYQNGAIDKDKCIQQMLNQALKRHDSWPNADFFEQVGAYTLGYGYGKELILKFCACKAAKRNSSVMKEFIEFMKRPLLPSQMQREISLCV